MGRRGAGAGAVVALRPVEPRDREALVRLYGSTRERELAGLGWDPRLRDAFVRQQFDAQDRAWRAAHPGARFDVVVDVSDGAVVGRLYVAREAEGVHVIDIALSSSWRGRGIGAGLLGQLAREADRDGLPLTLHVDRSNRALHLYTRLGLAVVEDLGVYLRLRREPVPAGQSRLTTPT